MSNYIFSYGYSGDSAYNGIASLQTTDAHYIAGGTQGRGIFTKKTLTGTTVWSLTYQLSGQTIGFSQVIECDNGDFMLYGAHVTAPERHRHLVVRVNKTGGVIWARTYHRPNTRYLVKLVKSVNDTYYFAAWYNVSSSLDDIEVIKINGSGTILATANVDHGGGDEQPFDMVAFDTGVALSGGTSSGPGWDGCLLVFNGSLGLSWARTVGDNDYQEARSLLHIGSGNFVLVGDHGPNGYTHVCQLNSSSTTTTARVMDLMAGTENHFKRVYRSGTGYYIIAQSPGVNDMTVTRLDNSFNVVWRKRLNVGSGHYFRDLLWTPNTPNSLYLAGAGQFIGGWNALLVSSDLDLNSCITQNLGAPSTSNANYVVRPWTPTVTQPQITSTSISLTVSPFSPNLMVICTDETFTIDGAAQFQSPYVYLQAAGSDGSDDSAPGFHLRWNFLRDLGNNHLAKGNLGGPSGVYPTSIAYNRNDDFVRVYRTLWREQFQVSVDFTVFPDTVVTTGGRRIWRYVGLVGVDPLLTVDVEVRFQDVAQYDLLVALYGVSTDLVRAYTGVFEVRTVDKFAFHYRVHFTEAYNMSPTLTGVMRHETISLPDALDTGTRIVSCREVAENIDSRGGSVELVCENIEYIRFDCRDDVAPIRIDIITYENYITGTQFSPGWTGVGAFSLELNDAVVFNRLERTGVTVHNTWRKYNEPSGGEFRVNVYNYQDRWTMPAEGLKEAVVSYLTLSQTDPVANSIIPNQDPLPNNSEMELSYLDMLNFVSLDYHVARMLGLGHIDPPPPGQQGSRFIYLMKYVTEAAIEDQGAALRTHLYMTPPVGETDYKYPPAPVLEPVVYGLFVDNSTSNPTLMTDANGYTPYADIRFVNLHREKFRHELPFEQFFQTPEQFCMCRETIPAGFGVEYGDNGVGSNNWVRPELVHDVNWYDPAGLPEVMPIADTGYNPVFTHQERNNGVHHYGLYSINWFSRVSPVSNEVETDYTQFPVRNTLLPPFNFQAQLIQKENPRIFTTASEQARLNALSGPDKTLVRVTFDWNESHNKAYQFADKVQFLYRNEAPSIVRGEISSSPGSIVVDTVNHLVTVKTTSYVITSTATPETVQPNIPSVDASRYVGGRLVIMGDAYEIQSVILTGLNPTLVLKQIRQTEALDADNDGIFSTTETWDSPSVGDRFIITENMDNAAYWDQVITKNVPVTNFLPTYTETVTHDDGTVQVMTMGGLADNVTITHLYDTDPNVSAGTVIGMYEVTFATDQLPGTGDPDIEYYGGKLRMRDWTGSENKVLNVWSVDTSGATLKLVVYDPDFVTSPIIPSSPSSQSGIAANFHPSYRAYLLAEGNFNATNILPSAGEGTRETFMAARSRDTLQGIYSYMTPPSVLLAREIVEPEIPGTPDGPMFATRPNFYGKATYTFDVKVGNPYSLIFYRASERRILDALYHPDTVQEILADLAALDAGDAAWFQDRWEDLANARTDGAGLFKEYVTGGYRFPIPDNDKYQIPDPSLAAPVFPFSYPNNGIAPGSSSIVTGTPYTMKTVVEDAIDGAYLPLTELPPVFKQLRQNTMQTSGRPPKVRGDNGERLVYGNAQYDPWPMCVRYEKTPGGAYLNSGDAFYGNAANEKYVRFTDYTLDGSSTNFYFYFAVELSNTLAVSGRSDVLGPIQLVNSYPAEAPGVKKVVTRLSDSSLGVSTGVVFELNDFVASERIVSFEIYRSTGLHDELSPRTMTLAKTVAVGDPLVDDFSDLTFPPYGDPVFYRLVALREILNEDGQTELVPSKPTQAMLVGLVDNVNPPAPTVSYVSDPPTTTVPVTLHNVVLSWDTTCYNGTYHLYKQTSAGNWQKIYTEASNAVTVTVNLVDTDWGSDALEKQDADLNTIYHRFKVQAVNSSGLLNRTYVELTI